MRNDLQNTKTDVKDVASTHEQVHQHSEQRTSRLMRLNDFLGRGKLLPISKSAWYQGIQDGIYPEPVKIGRISAWRSEEIHLLISEFATHNLRRKLGHSAVPISIGREEKQ